MPDVDIWGSIMMLIGMGLLFLLMSGMLIALVLLNLRLRSPSQPPTAPLEIGEVSSVFPPEEQVDGGGVK